MESKAVKWGNSLGIRIPSSLANLAEIKEGTSLDIKFKNGQIIIERKKYSLEELTARITPENRHQEIDWGGAVGKETW